MKWTTLITAWSLLDARRRRAAVGLFFLIVLAAVFSALMVASILPFLSILSDPSRIETTAPLRWAYETFGFTDQFDFVVMLGVGALAVILLASVMQVLRAWAIARFQMSVFYTLSNRLLRAYIAQPYAFFLGENTNTLRTRVLDETVQAIATGFRPLSEITSAVLTVAMLAVLVFAVNPVLAGAVFVFVALSYALAYLLTRRRLVRLSEARVTANAGRFEAIGEIFGGVKEITLLGKEPHYLDRFAVHMSALRRVNVNVQLLGAIPPQVLQLVSFGGLVLICLIMLDRESFGGPGGVREIFPTLGLLALAAQRLMPEMSRLFTHVAMLQYGRAALGVIATELDRLQSGQRVLDGDAPRLPLGHGLDLRDVSYRYPGSEAGISNLSMTVRAGDRIGLVGGTGAGKTTLADLILGLLVPDQGSLAADGTAITDQNRAGWRQTVGYVPQDIFLADASIADNIALGVAPEAQDADRIREAAEMAQLGSLLRDDLPEGLATRIGEKGVRLSGGQRQRIGIARALYHRADLLVFDEATSALDNATEREVMRAIDALPGDMTVVIIAHRLSTVRGCDRIAVLEKGHLVGFAPWDELMTDCPAFRKIADTRREG